MWADSPGDVFVSLANGYYDSVSNQSAAPPIDELERDFEKAGIPGLPTLYEVSTITPQSKETTLIILTVGTTLRWLAR
jgi:hypothetical protein